MNKIKSFINLIGKMLTPETASMLVAEAKSRGWKTKCVAYSYVWFTILTSVMVISSIVLLIVAGLNKEFTLYVDVLKDIILGVIKYVFYFFSIAVLATFGVTYIDGKLEVMNPPKEEEKEKKDIEVKENESSEDNI